MASRIPWDKQETAILIDAYIRVRNEKIPWQKAVKEVSVCLRRRAVLAGMEIDDIFRNENGIGLQMRLVASLIDEKPSGLNKSSKLFSEMVELYKTNLSEFSKILKKAKEECGMQVNVQEEFFSWLSGQVSSTMLSEFYIACKDIETFCMSKGILTAPLFETTDPDVIQRVANTVNSNRIFQLKYYRQIGKMRKVANFYLKFLRENQPVIMEDTNKTEQMNEQMANAVQEDKILQEAHAEFSELTVAVEGQQELMENRQAQPKQLEDGNPEQTSDTNPAEVRYVTVTPASVYDYSFTKPVSFTYFDDTQTVDSWTNLLVKMCSLLDEDYPSVIAELVGKPLGNGYRVAIGSASHYAHMTAPKIFANGKYVETNISAKDIMRRIATLLDRCAVDQENVTVKIVNTRELNRSDSGKGRQQLTVSEQKGYVDLQTASTDKQEEELSALQQTEELVKENRLQFIGWMEKKGFQYGTIFANLSALNQMGKFAMDEGYIEEKILLITDKDKLHLLRDQLALNNKFVKWNKSQNNRYWLAFKKYLEFRDSTVIEDLKKQTLAPVKKESFVTNGSEMQVPALASEEQVRYMAVMKEYFEDGFRPNSAIDRKRFKMYYSDKFGSEIQENDDQLVCTLRKVGTVRDDRIFAKDESAQTDLIEDIGILIAETFRKGASCIYLDCLYDKFKEPLAQTLHIYNADSLGTVILERSNHLYHRRYNYLYSNNREPATKKDVAAYVKVSQTPVTYEELQRELWYIPLDKIKQILVDTAGIVNVNTGAYLYAPNLPVSEGELQTISELIYEALLQRSYISDTEMMEMIEVSCPSVIMNTSEYPRWGLRNALAYLLKGKYSFQGPIISAKGEQISMAEVFRDYCRRSERLTVEELKDFAKELNTVIYWDAVYSEMVRVSREEFVNKEQIPFDVDRTDEVLDSLIEGAYAPLKEINLFLHFPSIGIQWNSFVLESYAAGHSEKFCLLHAGFTATDCYGAIVRRDAGISDYNGLLLRILSEDSAWHTKNDALSLLVDRGYQQRKHYKDIEKIIQQAKIRKTTSEGETDWR